ncbi:TIM22 inner membrane protein import complex subunit Tim13 [Schizosaccharomyces japonicus yFS275]|uniref:Mitochondrial import inner membrane translocase subunit n=1 Tax=Schizosaccharomyces japonicus (strain yFS275 / FY16936) TaxID=402676 RepID=B6JZC0_SCHJY|nr:TIM22 inner membrane protein import complex subunit Tim13 [Schizosaccharomyces japonicus yFS275]EEB06888.1 TIM22 inner membrane protein import complex subunit Tim13 [Schizosaccharomyces japonicus yFS275]
MSSLFGSKNKDAAASSEDKKAFFMKQVKQELAVAQAGELINKINDNCFDLCIPKPGSTFDKSDKACVSKCMERYMDAWNVVSKTYIARMKREQEALR